MALFTPSESPAVIVREADLTGGVPNVQSTTGALVGNFNWGPVLQRTQISNEAELVENFAAPFSEDVFSDFLSANQFLRYSSSLQLVRNISDSATTAYSLQGVIGATPDSNGDPGYPIPNPLILNSDDFDQREDGLMAQLDSGGTLGYGFAAKYPGAIGNSITVSYCPADSSEGAFNAWAYKGSFDKSPLTTQFAANLAGQCDEVHVVVVDELGLITGSRGTVLETYPNLSVASNAKGDDGQSIYVKDVLNSRSSYVYMLNIDKEMETKGAGDALISGSNFALDSAVAREVTLQSGEQSSKLNQAKMIAGYDLFSDKDQVEIDFLIAPSMDNRADQTSLVNTLISHAKSRKDCVVCAGPARNDIIGVTSDATKVTNTVTTANTFTNSSYLVIDNNFLKIYDKYNDKYRFIPAASTVAGIMASTDFNRAPWFSPAGARRGQLLGVTSLAYSPTKAQRDTLYKNDVNPIANIPGQGAVLFGDKTGLGYASAFDRINVRRLFLILERAIGKAAESVLFEFNDEFTRAEFVNIVEPVLREVQGRRGISDFRVVCDETNNTAAVVDRNEFKADIFIKPARSINYVTLNFVAVRSGVDFEEVVGTV